MEDFPFPSNEVDFSLPEAEFQDIIKYRQEEQEAKMKEQKEKQKEVKKEKEIKEPVKKEVPRETKAPKEIEKKKEEIKKVAKEPEVKKEKQKEVKDVKKEQKTPAKGRLKGKDDQDEPGIFIYISLCNSIFYFFANLFCFLLQLLLLKKSAKNQNQIEKAQRERQNDQQDKVLTVHLKHLLVLAIHHLQNVEEFKN